MRHATCLLLAAFGLSFGSGATVSGGLIFDNPNYTNPTTYAKSSGGAIVFAGTAATTIFTYDDSHYEPITPTSTLTTATQSGTGTDAPALRASADGSASASTTLTPGSPNFIFPALTATATQSASVSNAAGNTQSSGFSQAGNYGYFQLLTPYNFVFTMNLTDFSASASTSGPGDYASATSGAGFLLESLSYPYDPFSPFSDYVFIGTNFVTATSEDGDPQSLAYQGYIYNTGTGLADGYHPSITLSGVLGPGIYQYIMSGSASAEVSGTNAFASATDPISFRLSLSPRSASAPEPSSIAIFSLTIVCLAGRSVLRRSRAALAA